MSESSPVAPSISYPADLPVSARREDIMEAIRDHQVVVIAGETGSGKTTQIPKMCLELGLGAQGVIGHTQPRRIAARSVAERIAEELGEPIGRTVGYQVRFTAEVGEDTRIKLMTDGILLAEIQHDRLLRRYSAIIVDEAHERSLNIDFLLGYLRTILPQRPDLRVIITSATIDPERFARHFHQDLARERDGALSEGEEPRPAPIIEVSGRTYPVEIRYRPLDGSAEVDEDTDDGLPDEDRDPLEAVLAAVEELSREPEGDILVFFSGEREIRDAQEALEGLVHGHRRLAGTQILPLYGRLSMAEQHRVFRRSGTRRIVLATNVAETSLTVPGIKYVIDPGTARISRYSTRTKVQRLPIERISQASANQRAGRSGRVSEGICIRLYSQEDFDSRPEFTDPEILRTNLASVILQMISAGVVSEVADIARFPFVEPPETRSIKDGVAVLRELGALKDDDAGGRRSRGRRGRGRGRGSSPLTAVGRTLAALPVDPRLGRMIVEGQRRGCAREMLVVAAALTIQDPRERPLERRQQADELHARFKDPTSDVLSSLLLWQHVQEQQAQLSSSAFRRMCGREFLNFLRIREWQDLYAQLRQMGRGAGIEVGRSREVDPVGQAEAVHRSLLTGLLSHIGLRDERTRDYQGARGTRFAIFPGSALFKKRPDWVVSAELVETSRLWARVNAVVEPSWIEEAAGDLVKRTYAEPHWSRSQGAVMATERATLYGVPLVTDRQVGYWRIDPVESRELFIRRALVEGDWQTRHRFDARNRTRLAEVEQLESRLRRKDLRVDDQSLFEFFDARIPADVVSQRHFDSWWKTARQRDEHLLDLDPEALIEEDSRDWDDAAYPRTWTQATEGGELSLDLDYAFDPAAGPARAADGRAQRSSGGPRDGVTVRVPVLFLHQLREEPFRWQIPGLREELLTALIRSLPKALRKQVVPAPDVARQAEAWMGENADPDQDALETSLELAIRRLKGVIIPPGSWDWDAVPEHLRMHFQVRDARNRVLGSGDDLSLLQVELRQQVRTALAESLGAAVESVPVPGPRGSAASSDDDGGRGRRRRKGRSGRQSAGAGDGQGASSSASLERDRLTDWPSPELERKVDRVVAGQRLTGWPALTPTSGGAQEAPTVDVRVFSTAEDQRAAQRQGTVSLLLGRLPAVQRYLTEHLDNREKIVFTQSPHGSVDALIRDCTRAAVDKLVPAEPPWTRAEYDALYDAVRAEQIDTVFQVTAVVAEVLQRSVQVAKLVRRPGSMAAVAAFSDIREQLDRLVRPGFVTATGWEHLQHLPRYLRAMEVRVDKLVGTANIQRDGVAMADVRALEEDVEAAIAAVPQTVPVPEALTRLRWECQELRVSLFAQELGTAHSVSVKRVRRALREATA